MDEAQSVGLGLVFGVVVIFVLSIFLDEPFDSTEQDFSVSNKTAACPESISDPLDQLGGDEARTGTSCCVSALQAPERIVDSSSSTARERLERNREIEKAAQEMKIHKLQELLGLEMSKMVELLERVKVDATKGVDLHSSSSSSVMNYSSYLDVCFYAITLGLLALVLKTEYSINPFHIVTYLFPREAETTRKLLAVPFQYVSQLFG
ncbi:hypothetical protein FI667_g10410, partial [Globisporangium splendens]